ncbi:helix-turn-helix domain-containing protein [Salmonella enterica]
MGSFSNEKPIKHISAIIDAMLHSSKQSVFVKNSKIYFNSDDFCYLMIDGEAVIRSTTTQKIIARVDAPFIFGLNMNEDIYLQTTSEAIFNIIPSATMMLIIKEKNLWEHMYYILRRYTHFVFKRERILNAPSAYQIISALLHSLEEERDDVRYTTPIVTYIQDNSSLSRSAIYNIISELKNGQYIEAKRGILIKLNQLPKKF